MAKLVLRIPTGIVFAFHGSQKLFGAFGGGGLARFSGYLQKIGFPYPEIGAYAAGGTEFFCGLALIFGVFARLASLPLIFTMGVAIYFATWKNGFNIMNDGYEYNMILIAVLISTFLMGSGKFSIRE